MQNIGRDFTKNLSVFDDVENASHQQGMNDWAVPWSDLMMVMFVLFVVLFVYQSTHQGVRVLFSQQSSASASATSTLDPLIGLIGQISSHADGMESSNTVSVNGHEVLYRSRTDGISIVRESQERIKVTLRGALFFDYGKGEFKKGASEYLEEISKVIRLSVGVVHIIGHASANEVSGQDGFTLSSTRANDTAAYLMRQFDVDPKRIIVTGRGVYLPELPDISNKNNELNRRVEIVITNHI